MSSSRKRSRSCSSPGLGRQTSQQAHLRATLASNRVSTSSSYIDSGDCVYSCQACSALFWLDERLSSSSTTKAPEYHRCCKEGAVRLPLHNFPPPLFQSLFMQPNFLENIRRYNSVFSMTSFGATVDDSINNGSGPYVFKVEGQICHWIGTLCPSGGRKPSFLQLYVYDTANEMSNRLSIFQKDGKIILKPAILSDILSVLENCNQLVRLFRTARDLQQQSSIPDFAIRLFNSQNQVSYDAPGPGTIGAIVYGNECTASDFDIIVHQKDDIPKRISKLHPSYMSLQYPLLFPYGESGWSTALRLRTDAKDKQLTMNMFYSYQIHDRPHIYSLLLRGGRLFQQYIVDAYVSIEHSRLEYFRSNQNKFRTELLQGIHDAIHRGDSEGHDVGKRTYLPSSFTGGPRYMYKHYQDALAICRVHGNPQYFITFTCNVNWPEIQRFMARFPHLKPQDRPEMVSRVFRVKVKSLVAFLKDAEPFGRVAAHLYTIEFQKRGLPHCHLLLWVTDPFKIRSPEQIDQYISAEIPNPVLEPELYKIVTDLMIHGPCGKLNPHLSCMDTGKCSKNFPKDYEDMTTLSNNGYAHYRRRADGYTVTKNHKRIDNGYVVPYNRLLSLRYAAHINVEYCGWSMLIKYLFKYISKGTDRIRFAVTRPNTTSQSSSAKTPADVDEIQNFLDGRFICPHEAAWRILNFHIHERDPSVQVLAVHLENMQNITFTDSDSLESIVRNPCTGKTTLTGWLENNRVDPSGRHLRYIEYISEYRWDASGKFWIRRSRHRNPTVGRLAYIHPTCGESFYLRLLLTYQRGCQSFIAIRTVGERVLRTYREACEVLGLIGDSKEWLATFKEASAWATAGELRSLFTHMLLYCDVTNPVALWEENWESMADDVIHKHGLKNPDDIQQHILYELQLLLKSNASSGSASLTNYGLPLPPANLLAVLSNKLLMEEKNYDREELKREHEVLRRGLHSQQSEIYETVLASVTLKQQILLFVYGHGGTGKTYLWSTIISALRSTGKVVLAVAASGIAALLLPSGRTAHSRFRIPIKLNEKSFCDIKKNTQLSKLLEETCLIIWDEAPMSERCCLESLDRSLRDILDKQGEPFGGMSIILGGDFRQTLPIKRKASKHQILELSLPRSHLWYHFRICRLTVNMRLEKHGLDAISKEKIAAFSSWLLSVGNGTVGIPDKCDPHNTKMVKVPKQFLIPYSDHALMDLINFIYDEETLRNPTAANLSGKAIVCPRNHTVDEINALVLNINTNPHRTYLSNDSVTSYANNPEDTELLYPVEYLNSLHFSGLPPHCLELKTNSPVILLRNINQSLGLCNGTRLIVTQLLDNIIEARIITGVAIGQRVYIPRITLTHSDEELPFTFNRKQFPLRLCYAMTVNKSQGQSLNKIGVYLPQPVFSHGQLYVALSRATSPEALKIVIVPQNDEPSDLTQNIVYQDLLSSIDA